MTVGGAVVWRQEVDGVGALRYAGVVEGEAVGVGGWVFADAFEFLEVGAEGDEGGCGGEESGEKCGEEDE